MTTNDQIFQVIANAKGQGKWICLGTRIKPGATLSKNYQYNLPDGNHEYYLEKYNIDPVSGSVNSLRLINPWGTGRSIDLEYADFLNVVREVYILNLVL